MERRTKSSLGRKTEAGNQPETKIYEYFNTKKIKKDQITFVWAKKLKLSDNNFELFIYPHEEKENSFFRKLTSKSFEHLGYIKDYNFYWVLGNGKVKQSSDWVHYFFNTLSFRINTYFETVKCEGHRNLKIPAFQQLK